MKYLPNNKKYDIRAHSDKKLKGYSVVQGGCASPRYIYLVFEKKGKKSSTCKIVQLDGKTLRVIKVSKPLKIGHGNSICLKNSTLYITHSGTKKVIHTVHAMTLEKGKDIKVKNPKNFKTINGFNGIAPYKDGFILRNMGSRKLYICDSDFKIKKYITLASTVVSQDMDTYNNQIIRAFSQLQSKKNYVYFYDYKGKLLKKIHLKVKGELENVFVFNGYLYGTIYKKVKKKGKWKYRAYIVSIKKM